MLKHRQLSYQGWRRPIGTATVEFALTIPILVLLTLGMVEISQAVLTKQLLVNAARDGARSATLEGASSQQITTSVQEFLSGASISNASVSISPLPLTLAQGGDPVSVTVSVPFSSISWLPSPMFMGGIDLSATVVMRREVFTSGP
jgi:Flp pilus assembly protein TadG